MENKVHKLLDLVGTSSTSIEDAIQSGLRRASSTVRHMEWFEVKEIRGAIPDGNNVTYQVRFQVGFRLED